VVVALVVWVVVDIVVVGVVVVVVLVLVDSAIGMACNATGLVVVVAKDRTACTGGVVAYVDGAPPPRKEGEEEEEDEDALACLPGGVAFEREPPEPDHVPEKGKSSDARARTRKTKLAHITLRSLPSRYALTPV
jgi:hypothetical protein